MPETDWFARRRWGVFCHYLTDPATPAEQWSQQVDSFDVPGLVEQLKDVGAGYFFITLGQGSGHYCSPNQTYDRITGFDPSKCSKRDLVADLYDALAPAGIDLLVYAPADPSWADRQARNALGMTEHWCEPPGWKRPEAEWAVYRWTDCMRKWEDCCREWSLRWGRKVRGWWIDGCYKPELRYPEDQEPNFKTLAAALRAGNPDAIVTFNTGIHVPPKHVTPHEDYTAGETDYALHQAPGPWREYQGHRARTHLLTFMGDFWCQGKQPRFPDEMAAGYTAHWTVDGEGVLTWDVPITPRGQIPEPFVRQLRAVGEAVDRRQCALGV